MKKSTVIVIGNINEEKEHALLAGEIKDILSLQSRITVYDPNYPGEDRFMLLNKDSFGNVIGWEYDMGAQHGIWGTQSDVCKCNIPVAKQGKVSLDFKRSFDPKVRIKAFMFDPENILRPLCKAFDRLDIASGITEHEFDFSDKDLSSVKNIKLMFADSFANIRPGMKAYELQ